MHASWLECPLFRSCCKAWAKITPPVITLLGLGNCVRDIGVGLGIRVLAYATQHSLRYVALLVYGGIMEQNLIIFRHKSSFSGLSSVHYTCKVWSQCKEFETLEEFSQVWNQACILKGVTKRFILRHLFSRGSEWLVGMSQFTCFFFLAFISLFLHRMSDKNLD